MRERAAHQALATHAMAQRELAKMDNALAAYYAAKRQPDRRKPVKS